MNILDKIDKLRIERNWTFYKLAEQSSLPVSTITNMFARKSDPSIATLTAICQGLGITLSQFFAESELDINAEQEKEIIETFRKLDPDSKLTAINMLKLLQKPEKRKIKQSM